MEREVYRYSIVDAYAAYSRATFDLQNQISVRDHSSYFPYLHDEFRDFLMSPGFLSLVFSSDLATW